MAAPATFDGDSAAGAHPEFAVQESTVHAPADAHDLSSESSSELASDLSSEWEESLSVDQPAPVPELPRAAEPPATFEAAADTDASSNPEIAETVEEIRFYLDHYMTDQARAGIEKLEFLTRDARILAPLRAAVESSQPLAEPEAEITEINADEPADSEVAMETGQGFEAAATPDRPGDDYEEGHHETHDQASADSAPEPAHAEAAHAKATDLTALVADLEASLGDSFPHAQPPDAQPLPGWPAAPAAARTPQPEPVARRESEIPAPAATRATAASAGVAANAAAPTMSYSPAPVRPLGAGAQAMHASDSVDLSEMFGELKQELEEEVIAGDDDPETHYSLGVAFREMGLLDEAIAEFQKVCNAIDRGKAFSQPVQTYTWLAQCFLDKGVPDAAIHWYEKALGIPGLDQEARLAINYELGSACETAHDKPAALRHFTDVYGANIDYRDVAERIQALKS